MSLLRTLGLVLVLGACARSSTATPPAAARAGGGAPLLVVLVRHGEKAPAPANDPVLSDAGMARAAALDASLRELPITDVVVSQLQRTRLTASVFITRSGAAVHVVPIGPAGVAAHVKDVADTVRAISQMAGHTGVLVVGHSNTVTSIVEALGGGATPALCDSQYSQFYMLRGTVASMQLTRKTYGAADPSDATCGSMR